MAHSNLQSRLLESAVFGSLIMGCLAGVAAVLSFVVLLILHTQSVATTARIVRYEEIQSKDGRSYKAIYAYDVDGKTFEGRSLRIFEKPEPETIGAEVAIRYVSNRPGWSSEDSIFAIYFLPIITAIASGFSFVSHRFFLWCLKKVREGEIGQSVVTPASHGR